MTKYNLTFKKRVIAFYLETKSYKQVTEAFGISKSRLHDWLHKDIEKNSLLGNKNAQKLDEQAFITYVEANPDITQIELAKKFDMSQQGIAAALKRLGFTYKKNKNLSRGK